MLEWISDRWTNDVSKILGFEVGKCWESEGRGSDGEEEQGDESEESESHVDDSEASRIWHVKNWGPAQRCKVFSNVVCCGLGLRFCMAVC